MLAEIIVWWAERMAELVPRRLRQSGPSLPDGLIVDVADPATLVLFRRRRRRESRIGQYRADEPGLRSVRQALRGRAERSILRLPSARILERPVVLPIAADRDLERVLTYELDRLTPFGADEVFWSWRVEQRDRLAGKLHVRLSLVPREGLAPLIAALGAAGAPPVSIETGPDAQGLRTIRLSRAPDPGERRRRRLVAALGVLCGVMGLAAAGLPFWLQSQDLDAVAAQIDMVRPGVAKAEAVRRRMADNANGADVIVTEAARLGDAMAALAALTDLLPNDTYLTDLTLRQRKLTMEGQSAAAARLIGVLSSDPTIRDPTFTAPVTRNDSGKADIFSLRASLGP